MLVILFRRPRPETLARAKRLGRHESRAQVAYFSGHGIRFSAGTGGYARRKRSLRLGWWCCARCYHSGGARDELLERLTVGADASLRNNTVVAAALADGAAGEELLEAWRKTAAA